MKFCSSCGGKLDYKKVSKEETKRFICLSCNKIHYQNPINVAGSILLKDNRVLLCKRAIEPRYGKWTLPAGFVENFESTSDAAEREALEEAGVIIKTERLYAHINVVHVCQVHCFYLGKILKLDLPYGHETLEIKFFSEQEIPWSELSFPTVEKTLRYYFKEGAQAKVFEMKIDKRNENN